MGDSDVGADFVGRVLAGKLRLDAMLATGSMGAVFRARHLGLDKDVAVKLLRPDRAPDPEICERFIREARAASRLDHPNSVAVLDFGQDPDGLLYLAMELLEGETLFQTLFERGRIPLREACYLLGQVLAALAAAHESGILHRDIKPSNIMLVPRHDDDGRPSVQVKVCDFGLAKFAGATDTIAGAGGQRRLIGTPLYMSPEQAVSEVLDERSDIYACGVVLFEMLTGRPPFEAERAVSILMKHCASPVPRASEMAENIPTAVDAVIDKALEKDRNARFQTARAFRAAVLELMNISPVVAERPEGGGSATAYFLTPSSTGPFEPVPRPKRPIAGPLPPMVEASAMLGEVELPIEGPVEAEGATPVPDVKGSDSTRYEDLSDATLGTVPHRGNGHVPVSSLSTPAAPSSSNENRVMMDAPVGDTLPSRGGGPRDDRPEEPDDLELLPRMRLYREGKGQTRQKATDVLFLWERYALSPHRRPPARGFWLRDAQENHIGPLTFDELCVALRLEAHDGALDRCLVAADPKPDVWRSAVELLSTLQSGSVARLDTHLPLPSDGHGWIDPTAIPAMLVRASRSEMTGRLMAAATRAGRRIFFEVHVVGGRPTHVETNELKLQLPSVLIARGALAEEDIPLLVNDAWTHGHAFDVSARRLCGVDIDEHRAGVVRHRLRQLLKLSEGTWVLDSSFRPAERRPTAPSLSAVLPRLVREALPRSTMEAALLPHLGQPLSAYAGIDESIEALGFTSGERTMAEELLAAPRLEAALPAQEDLRRAYTAVAYLLVASARHPG